MMGSDMQKNARLDRQRILDVKDDDGVTALMMLGSFKTTGSCVSGSSGSKIHQIVVGFHLVTTHLSLNIVGCMQFW